ncbi:hemerythrin domain-containing protein [Streptomyces antimicrobicus]|uniref:Hemerythrin domain-containing protein n=1 Tax=Streptomyces antimicrobicus TaxID=2883108 RepID=A0ABS8B036_9ACTN|nr:hemerythrin domain-containing protein [Streptomyces antimicrobicus]MCB5177976.1 hemerythrin domain-containing protein [Streptomyces antimicrobicus]
MSRSIAQQSVDELGGQSSVLARQRRDHEELDRLMHRYASGGLHAAERQKTLKEIFQLTFSHAFAEETVLWPALRRLAPDGAELTARVEEEHQQINELATRIESTEPDDPRHDELTADAFALIRQDIREEEDVLLPRLQEVLGHDGARLRRLGTTWETVRRTAPTRPHPGVSRRPPGNALAGVPLSAVDRARDALSPPSPRTLWIAAALVAACVVGAALRRKR